MASGSGGVPGSMMKGFQPRADAARGAGQVSRTVLLAPPAPPRGNVPRPWVIRRDQSRAASVFSVRPPLHAPLAAVAGKPFQPRLVRGNVPAGRAEICRNELRRATPAPIAGGVPRPLVVRRDHPAEGKVFRVQPPPKQLQALTANGVPRPWVVRQDARRPALIYASKLLPVPPSARPGIYIELKSGPLSSMPILRANEPAFTSDSHQLFVGDGFDNHLQLSYVAPPAHSSSAGFAGQISWDGSYFYICVSVNTWLRCSLSGGF